jgi:serine/threonine protein kinase
VRTVNFDDGCHPARDTPKNRALQDDLLMQTVSTGSEASDGDGATSSSSSSSSLRTHARSAGAGGLSVTGRTSNVHDDYVIFPKVLGEGHYGKVRECVHRTSRLVRACKTIDKSRIGRLDHLQREVHLLSCIEHGGIMRMVDCYEDEEYVHIVTERYTGGELFEKIIDSTTPRGCLSEERTSHVIGSLLDAVGYLHENDIVHRDIKPENILFESKREDSIRLIDFGLSRRHGRGDAHMSNPVGTAYYMSPELLKGKYDKSCDLWSVGVVAYILLCGYPPFNGDTDLDIFDSIKRGHFEFPNQAWSDKSDMARDFIKCLLRRDPRKRFTAKEASLHPWIANQRTTTRQQCPR